MLRRMQIILGSLAILLSTAMMYAHATSPHALEPPSTKERPLIELDLRTLHYAEPSPNGPYKAGETLRSSIDFTEGNSLLLAWITRDNKPSSAKRGMPYSPEPAHLHVEALDALTGREKAKQQWPGIMTMMSYSVLDNGNLVTCIDKEFRLFSIQFELLAERELPPTLDCRAVRFSIDADVASGGRFVRVFYGVGHRTETLDAETLHTISTATEPTAQLTEGGNRQALVLTPRARYPINAETVLVWEEHSMTIQKTDGTILFQVNLPKNRSYGPLAFEGSGASVVGERFAVMENRIRGIESSILDLGKFPSNERILVYDISERQAVFALEVKGLSPWIMLPQHTNQFALSQGGNLVAVVSDGVLRIYKLPARSVVH
jgi:hypothetical protein